MPKKKNMHNITLTAMIYIRERCERREWKTKYDQYMSNVRERERENSTRRKVKSQPKMSTTAQPDRSNKGGSPNIYAQRRSSRRGEGGDSPNAFTERGGRERGKPTEGQALTHIQGAREGEQGENREGAKKKAQGASPNIHRQERERKI